MFFFIFNIIVIGTVFALIAKLNRKLDEGSENSDVDDMQRELATFPEIVKLHGYKSETHTITTTDGYILTVHRILRDSTDQKRRPKPVVLLLHGLGSTTEFWLLRGPNRDLAFLLENVGYDVWLINFRGNFYSNLHRSLDCNRDFSYWNFSFDEMGLHDLPSTIDYILEKTKNPKLTLVGHSMGNAVTYVLLSSKPEYNEKVNLVISFAPVAVFARPLMSFLRPLLPYLSHIYKLSELLKIHNVRFGLDRVMFLLHGCSCYWPGIEAYVQTYISYLIGACARRKKRHINSKLFQKFLRYQCRASYLKNAVFHYGQLQNTGNFRPFDRSFQSKREGKFYPLEKIEVPVIAYYGLNDGLCRKYNVEALVKILPNAIKVEIDDELFSHNDFLWGNDAKKLLYDSVIFDINKYNDLVET